MASVFFIILLLCFSGAGGFEWGADLPDNSVIYKCSGQDVYLLWKFNATQSDVVHDIQWFYHGQSQELIAIFSRGNFVPLPSFAHRVHFVPNAGLIITDIISGDSGNYSIEISGGDSSGSLITHGRSVLLQVSDSNTLQTTDGQLHATLEPKPVYSQTTGQWSLVLSCGNFSYPSQPPFALEWLTPSGSVLPSTRYEGGRFQLDVQTGGNYTCRVSQQTASAACLTSSPLANVSVDSLEARLTLMEVRQRDLENRNRALEDKNAVLEVSNADLTTLVQSLNNTVHFLSGKVANTQIGFYGMLSHEGVTHGRLSFAEDAVSYGPPPGFAADNGTFIAALPGLYYLLMTATPHANTPAYAEMKRDGGRVICHAYGSAQQSVTCATVQHLDAGSQVWVQSSYNLYHFGTHFSGFLIAAD